VLDVAAAPGGKATAAGERASDGLVVAVDLHPGRLGLVRQAVARLRLDDVVHTVVADGRGLPVALGAFDRVLVDTPCTGLGVLRRRPEARWRILPGATEPLGALQRALLLEAATAVRPGGLLVYSVCTLTRAETTGVAGWAAANLDGFKVLPPPGPPWEPSGQGARLLPHREGTDGMFVCAFRRD
jgi:16S rRNA (cytosine967-C5)-methyltransferase